MLFLAKKRILLYINVSPYCVFIICSVLLNAFCIYWLSCVISITALEGITCLFYKWHLSALVIQAPF
jgi:hypothetical protein